MTELPNIPAVRYNNPGDVSLPIDGWTGGGEIVGIPGQPGYAKFPTMQIGFEAFQADVRRYIAEGRTSIAKIGEVYAVDPSWGVDVASIAGIRPFARLHPSNAAQMATVAAAIIRQETGLTLVDLGIAS